MTSRDTGTFSRSPLHLLKPYRWQMLGLLGLIGVSGLAEALGLLLLSALLNVFLASQSNVIESSWLASIYGYALASPRLFLIALGLTYISKSVLALCANFMSYSLALRMMHDWQTRFVRDFLHAPLSRLDKQQGVMLQIIMDEPVIVGLGIGAGGVLIQNVFSVLTVCMVLLYVSPMVTLGLAVVAAAALVFVSGISRHSRKIGIRRSEVFTDGYTFLAEMLSALKLLRLFHLEDEIESRAVSRLDMMREMQVKANVVASSPRLVIEMVFLCGLVVMVLAVSPRMGEAAILPALGLAVAAAVRLLPSFSASAGTWVQMQQAWPAMQKISAELAKIEAAVEDEKPASRQYPVWFSDRIKMQDIHFSYPGREQALAGVDLEIARGSLTAIVGPSGAGKSTLVDLLCGFYAPDRGQILIDGVDLRQVAMPRWRRQLGVVSQDGFLLSGTLRDNLCLLRPDCPEDLLREIVALVGADRFIRELPKGYETWVGERGVTLSGGQRQRIALARVLVREPRVLILDEATSALDVESERALLEELERLRGRLTMLVIAHRLSTVRHADRIYVVNGGKVVESGPHESLLQHGGLYAAMRRTSEIGLAR